MKALRNKVNVTAPDGTYIYGKLRNNPGDNTGTPVDEELFNDSMQLFEAVMADAGITPNNLPDNLTNGFQLYNAFIEFVRNKQASETQKGTAEIATNAETITGTDALRMITPANLTAWAAQAWVLRQNVADVTYTVVGIGVTVGQSKIKYRLIGKTMHIIFYAEVTNSVNAPTEFYILIPDSKTANVGFDFYFTAQMLDAGSFVNCIGKIETGNNTKIKIYPANGVTLTNPSTTTISGQLTFEIA